MFLIFQYFTVISASTGFVIVSATWMNMWSKNWWSMCMDESNGELISIIITSSLWPDLWAGDIIMFHRSKLSSVSLKSMVSKCAGWSRWILKSPISSSFPLSLVMCNSIRFNRALHKREDTCGGDTIHYIKCIDNCAILWRHSLHSMVSV